MAESKSEPRFRKNKFEVSTAGLILRCPGENRWQLKPSTALLLAKEG